MPHDGTVVALPSSTATRASRAQASELGLLSGAVPLAHGPDVLGAGAAGYTAFLLQQCEGRDLWQTKSLLPHLLAQALLLGAMALLIASPSNALVAVALFAAFWHLGFALQEARGAHHTDNARQAASLLPRIPAWKGTNLKAFSQGLQLSTAAPLIAAACILLSTAALPGALALCAVAAAVGVFFYEQAFVRAGQLPPLS